MSYQLGMAMLVTLLTMSAIGVPVVVAQEGGSPTLMVTAEMVNVHGGPDVTVPVVDVLWQGDQVDVIGYDADSGWWHVSLPDGGVGWVRDRGDNLAISGDISALSAPADASGADQEATGWLVFQTDSGGPIYIVEVASQTGTATSEVRYLTTGVDPGLSPDGQWVAFTRWDDTQHGALGSLWVINVDGTGERLVADQIHQPKSPAWSPDGTQIAIAVQDGGRLDYEHYCGHSRPDGPIYNPDDDEPDVRVVVEIDDDGGIDVKLCYTLLPHPYWSIQLVDVASGAVKEAPHNRFSYTPTWDPANDWHLVYRDDEKGLVSIDINQGTSWALTQEFEHAPTNDLNDHTPVFSPDGTQLAVSYWQNDHWEVHVVNADGSGRVRLTQTPASVLAEQSIAGQEPQSWNNAAPAWSPDGSQIAFLTDRTGQWEIWVMHTDGSNQQPMFPDGTLDGLTLEYHNVDERVISWK
jgi:sugar lactone lactonase YvrE